MQFRVHFPPGGGRLGSNMRGFINVRIQMRVRERVQEKIAFWQPLVRDAQVRCCGGGCRESRAVPRVVNREPE